MNAHTPGPWRFFLQGDGTRFHITARPATKPGNSFDDFAQVDVRHEADARLIAAAPDLLAALRDVLALGDDKFWSATNKWPQVAAARAAIAAAEGK